MITGACLCGAVRYETDAPVHELVHCHCSACRKHHGAPFATFADVPSSSFRWLSGEAALLAFRSPSGHVRAACAACGAVAPTSVGQRVRLPASNLLGELGQPSARHAFVAAKPPWHHLAHGLPEHEGAPPDWPHEAPAAAVRQDRAGFDQELVGSCLCRRVTFAVTGKPNRWLQCNCSRCRRGRSAAHGSNAFYPLAQFRWQTGQDLVHRYKLPEAERFSLAFCTECAGGVPVVRDNVPFVLVPMGVLDDDPGFGPEAYIHVASKAPWYPLAPDLPQFAELPP